MPLLLLTVPLSPQLTARPASSSEVARGATVYFVIIEPSCGAARREPPG